MVDHDANRLALAEFYSRHPYPAPESDLDHFARGDATLDGTPSHFLPLYWPERRDVCGLEILLAGVAAFSGIRKMRPVEAFAAMELLRGTMITHRFIASRDDGGGPAVDLDDAACFERLKPEPYPGARLNLLALPKGVAGQLWHPLHGYPDLLLNLRDRELAMYQATDGKRTLPDIARRIGASDERVRACFRKFWGFDQVMFRRG